MSDDPKTLEMFKHKIIKMITKQNNYKSRGIKNLTNYLWTQM